MIVEAFVSSVNQSIETVIEEIRIQIAGSLKDGFLNKTATCQVLLQRSEEMKITWCEIRAVGRVFQSIPFHWKSCFKSRNRGRMRLGVVAQQQGTFRVQ
ncbi:hypothetical protein AVEN_240184-1 [Araneus ventricosus]|uniref:Uncharacterized protein n=1 Tax=Araneus ventricosus TaxID=182803 RepID=A0A4Y2FPL5_ARAVE|nr:hypothetical protein AVEN_240184-1 [Araneus ventricosus]